MKKRLIMVPGPTNVPESVMAAMDKPIISHRCPEFRELNKRISEDLKYVFQTANDVFPLTCSGTGGVECGVANIVEPGDKVVVPVNGLFSQRLKETIQCFGGVPIEVPAEWGSGVPVERIKSAVEEEKATTVALVYNETSTGVTLRQLEEVGRVAEDNGALFFVDAVSILGGDALPVDRWKVDICITASQKCLACPPGLAFISVSEKAWKKIGRSSRTFYFDLKKCKEFLQKDETPFTPAVPLYFALDEALKLIREEGLENRIERHRTCAKAFYEGVTELGLCPFPEQEYRSNTVIAIKVPPGIDDSKLRSTMYKNHDVEIAGGPSKLKGRVIRIGSMGIVSRREVLATIEALGEALSGQGFKASAEDGVNAAAKTFK